MLNDDLYSIKSDETFNVNDCFLTFEVAGHLHNEFPTDEDTIDSEPSIQLSQDELETKFFGENRDSRIYKWKIHNWKKFISFIENKRINIQDFKTKQNRSYLTELCFYPGKKNIVELLVKKRLVNLNIKDKEGNTALHTIANRLPVKSYSNPKTGNPVEKAKILLETQATPDIKNNEELTVTAILERITRNYPPEERPHKLAQEMLEIILKTKIQPTPLTNTKASEETSNTLFWNDIKELEELFFKKPYDPNKWTFNETLELIRYIKKNNIDPKILKRTYNRTKQPTITRNYLHIFCNASSPKTQVIKLLLSSNLFVINDTDSGGNNSINTIVQNLDSHHFCNYARPIGKIKLLLKAHESPLISNNKQHNAWYYINQKLLNEDHDTIAYKTALEISELFDIAGFHNPLIQVAYSNLNTKIVVDTKELEVNFFAKPGSIGKWSLKEVRKLVRHLQRKNINSAQLVKTMNGVRYNYLHGISRDTRGIINLKIMKLFLQRRIFDVNSVDSKGNTTLHTVIKKLSSKYFCSRGTPIKKVKLLLRYGANLHLKNYEEETTLDLLNKTKITDFNEFIVKQIKKYFKKNS